MTLEPIVYRIKQNEMDGSYRLQFLPKLGWVVALGAGYVNRYLTEGFCWTEWDTNAALFDTHGEALHHWRKYADLKLAERNR